LGDFDESDGKWDLNRNVYQYLDEDLQDQDDICVETKSSAYLNSTWTLLKRANYEMVKVETEDLLVYITIDYKSQIFYREFYSLSN